MDKSLRIHRKLSGKHIVWFGESKQWVAFEKPAYKVYKHYSKGHSIKKSSKKIARKYGLEKKEAKTFVKEVCDELNKITAITTTKISPVEDKIPNKNSTNKKEKNRSIQYSYLINQHSLSVDYNNEKLAYYLHAPIKHFKTEKIESSGEILSVAYKNNIFSIHRNGVRIESCSTISELKHAFIKSLMHSVYGVDRKEWFAWIHASAVTNGDKAIIFSSASGSGKSTIATILQSQGYRVVSDDMIYMRNKDKLTYPVPVALSIKNGANKIISKYIPAFKPEELEVYKYGDRKIRFKTPEHDGKEFFTAVPVKCIVFIQYKQNSDFSIKKLSDYEAFVRFHKEAWINETRESALAFINWFEELSYHELCYSDTEKAIEQVKELFVENS
jgi:hypothetical protein